MTDQPRGLRMGDGLAYFPGRHEADIFTNELFYFDKYDSEAEELAKHGYTAEPGKYISTIDNSGINYLDQINFYRRNSYGYRSPEFSSETDLVFAGCSFTFGLGVPEEAIWGSQVAAQFDMSYANISLPGRSVQWVVRSLFAYFKKYGNPKVVACLFPDFQRMTMTLNPDLLISTLDSDSKKGDHINQLRDIHLYRSSNAGNRPKYSERPHFVEDVIPVDLPVFISIQHILMLEQYCESNGIVFAWGVWDPGLYEFLAEVKDLYGYSSYVDTKILNWIDKNLDGYREMFHETMEDRSKCNGPVCTCPETCHLDLRDKYGDNFYRGADNLYGDQTSHFGVHKHTHIADAFIAKLESLDEFSR